MLAVLVESSIRAVLLIAAVALVLRAMRIRTASVRHAVWAGVVVTMLVLPLTVAWGPKVALRWLPAEPQRAAAPVITSGATAPLAVAEGAPVAARQVDRRMSWTWEGYVEGLYFAGLALFLLRLGIGTLQVQRLMRLAVVKDGQRMHAACATPITVGCVAPMVILPRHWPQWPQAQLNAVLAHENAHVSRRDPLFQYIGLLNRAVFWFHPLAWWLDRQLSGLAEEACDDIVLSQGYDPHEYSQYLVSIARSLEGDGNRVEMVGMAMPGVGLPQRVRRMLAGASLARTSRLRMIATCLLAGVVVALLATGSLAQGQRSRQGPPPTSIKTAAVPALALPEETKPSAPVLMAQAPSPAKGPVPAVPASAVPVTAPESLHFEVASVRASGPPSTTGDPLAQHVAAMALTTGGPGTSTPERITVSQTPLRMLLWTAFGVRPDQISGPSWLDSTKFDITANVAPGTTKEQVTVMLRNLLIERFKITLHQTSELNSKAYQLTIAKNGLKMTAVEPIAQPEQRKLTGQEIIDRMRVTLDAEGFPIVPEGQSGIRSTPYQGLTRITCRACSMEEIMRPMGTGLAIVIGSPPIAAATADVVDRTGLTGKYDFHLEYSGNGGVGGVLAPPSLEPTSGQDFFTALEKQLGLKLEKTKVLQDVLVIDHIERVPTEN